MKKDNKNRSAESRTDDLFARKLGHMSLPPRANGFERLQARMHPDWQQPKLAVWRNPNLQRYMAIAACLVLVCLLGWRHWPSGSNTLSTDRQTADSRALRIAKPPVEATKPNQPVITGQPNRATLPGEATVGRGDSQLATTTKINKLVKATPSIERVARPQPALARQTVRPTAEPRQPLVEQPVVAQAKPTEPKNKLTDVVPPAETNTPLAEQPVQKPVPTAERVLVVTISEPATLIAARQAAQTRTDEKGTVATTDKLEKEPKPATFWQQIKRVRDGEIFASREPRDNSDERGLLGRAYSSLRHNLDKGKTAKQ